MRILIILEAGVVPEFEGLLQAYYLFRDAGLEVVVAAPGGGSASEPAGTAVAPAMLRFKADRPTRDVMNDLLDLASVCADDFDAALCLGSFQSDSTAGIVVARLLAAAKPVAMIAEASRLAAHALLGAIGIIRG